MPRRITETRNPLQLPGPFDELPSNHDEVFQLCLLLDLLGTGRSNQGHEAPALHEPRGNPS